MSTVDLSHLRACIEDAQRAAQNGDRGPSDPTQYEDLLQRLGSARLKLPPLYRETVADPLMRALESLGPGGFRNLLRRDPQRVGAAGTLLDIAQAVLQNGEGYQEIATDAFQEVLSDLYDGFLSAEDRRHVKPPDRGVIPPLAKWGEPDFGPYTWPVDATAQFGVRAAIVNLPPANAKRGLLAWAALAHETAGHDILDADTGLKPEMADAVEAALNKAKMPAGIPKYWASRIDETASDVMGILNMGPAAGIALVGYFRALNAAWGDGPRLRNEGPEDDPHPADVVRGFLAASVVRLLRFTLASDWADAIEAETMKDVSNIVLGDRPIPTGTARRSAEVVATVIARRRLQSLEDHALGEIQDWRDHDEMITARLRGLLQTDRGLPTRYPQGVYAAHAVAAAVTAALEKGGKVAHVFERMEAMLKTMHNLNPSWGPLYVEHPGDLSRRFARLKPVARWTGALAPPATPKGAVLSGSPKSGSRSAAKAGSGLGKMAGRKKPLRVTGLETEVSAGNSSAGGREPLASGLAAAASRGKKSRTQRGRR